AQATGRGDEDKTVEIALRYGAIALAVGIGLLILHPLLRELGFALLQGTTIVKASGREYFNARILSAPANLLLMAASGWFLGRARSSAVLVLTGVGSFSNIAFNYGFVVHLGWGARGAGWGTAMSEYLALVVAGVLLGRSLAWPRVQRVWRQAIAPAEMLATLHLNANLTVRTLALLLTFSCFTSFSAAMGTTVLAAQAILLQVFTFAAYFIDGFAFAAESLTGMLLGRDARNDLPAVLWLSGSTSFVTGVGIAIACLLFPAPMFGVLTDRADLLARIREFVPWLIPILGIGAIAFALDGYFLGLSAGRPLRQSAMLSAAIGFFPLALTALHQQRPHLLWLALTGFMLARVIFLGAYVPQTLRSPVTVALSSPKAIPPSRMP
ncbi:MAG: MATE family efflux transporter, partial [Cyanobacteria bacterium J06648_11]